MKKATTPEGKEHPELEGFDHELDFWARFVKSERFQKHWLSDEPTPELRHPAGAIIATEAGGKPNVLDVGSGAVSILRGTIPWADITEVDPLANEYLLMWDYCRVKKGYVEKLDAFGQFDVVHISNALDHCQDPMQGLASMIRACKPGGLVYIQGFVNEAKWHQRAGLHQWDLDLHGHRLVIQGRYRLVFQPENVVVAERQVLHPKAKVSKIWFHFAFRKTEDEQI